MTIYSLSRFFIFTLSLLWCSTTLAADQQMPKRVETSSDIPSDAVVIFNGKGMEMLVGQDGKKPSWLVKNGVLICKPQNGKKHESLWTTFHFRDAQVHVEFMVPPSDKKGEGAGNSGLYFHGLFEHQILESQKNSTVPPKKMIGSIYRIKAPLVNASRKTGEWQTYDILFKAPRRNDKGEPIQKGSFTTFLNGVVVQWNTPVLKRVSTYTRLYYKTTPYSDKILASLLKTECGPLQLQDHHNPVQFRKIWIRPLDEKSFQFNPNKQN